MKTNKYIISLLLLMLTTALSAQVVEVESYGHFKYYMADVDSIVYVPVQDWSIAADVDRYYVDSNQEAHAVVTITVGPNAHVARAGFGAIWEDSVPSIKLIAGTMQTIDVVLPDKQNACMLNLYTKNQYHSYYDCYGSVTVDASALYWVDYGTALYREDLVASLFLGIDNLVYEVPIQKNTLREGYYRLVNPYGAAYPYNDPGDWDDSVDSYLTINATDPDFVYVENSPTTTDWGYGIFTMTSYAAYYLGRGYTKEEIPSDYFGTLKDGVITMPQSSMLISMANYANGGFYLSNRNGLFAVALPGATLENYSARAADAGIGTDKGNKAAMLKTDVRPAKVAGANMPKNMMKAPSGGAEHIDAQSIQRSKGQKHLIGNGLK